MNKRTVKLAILVGVAIALAAVQVMPMEQGTAAPCGSGSMNLDQAISDQAQRTTIAFSGLAMITGNLEAQSFFPPGKLVDYWGFQYLRDNDPDNMGHNTSFLTRASCNMIYILDQSQFDKLKAMASGQVSQINEYGYKRYPLMKAFRRLMDGDLPAGAQGLDLDAVKAASKELYELDGQISFDRAVMYAEIFRSWTTEQRAYVDAMVGQGFNSWPNKTMDDVRDKMAGLSQDESVAVMTYAGDLFSWYAGCVAADIYFCPERHGTYYGGFYIKDAPAMGHPGYSIDEQLTATAGAALCDSSKGYVTPEQAALVSSLTDTQRNNLYAGASNIVQARTDISTALRSLITPTEPTPDFLAQVKDAVVEKSGEYGDLDGENNFHYATVFSQLRASLSAGQLASLSDLRRSILSGTYSDGTPFDFTVCTTYFLFSAAISDPSVLTPYISDTDYLFGVNAAPVASFSLLPSAPLAGQAVQFSDNSTGSPTSWAWDFGDGATSAVQNPSHAYAALGAYTVTLTASNSHGSDTASITLTVAPSCTITGIAAAQSPFRLKISGVNFQLGCTVLVNGQPAPTTLYKSAILLVAKGDGLKASLPKGVAVQVVVVNPDGSQSSPFAFTR